MDRLLREHLEATYFAEYQVLRDELVDILVDDDLAFRPEGQRSASANSVARSAISSTPTSKRFARSGRISTGATPIRGWSTASRR